MGIRQMPQQKGMKRAVKVAARARKKKINARTADLRRVERAEEVAAAPAAPAKK